MIIQKTISLKDELWIEIDKTRRDVSRSRFIANILADYFDKSVTKSSEGDEIHA